MRAAADAGQARPHQTGRAKAPDGASVRVSPQSGHRLGIVHRRLLPEVVPKVAPIHNRERKHRRALHGPRISCALTPRAAKSAAISSSTGGGVVDGAGDLLAEQFAVTPTEPVDGHPDGPLGRVRGLADGSVRGPLPLEGAG